MELADVRKLPEFDNHHQIIQLNDEASNLQGFIVIHRASAAHPAFGATRLWSYASHTDALREAMRLSKTMSYKAAMAGLNVSGGKAVIVDPHLSSLKRQELLRAYANRLNTLEGKFVTGTDMGLTQGDINEMKHFSPYLVGFRVDPVKYTARGLISGIKIALKERFGNGSLKNRSFAIEGLGKIGMELLRRIYGKAEKIHVTDINPKTVQEVIKIFPKLIPTAPAEIINIKADVFSPCGGSHSLTHMRIGQMRCEIIAGGANNQLEDDGVGDELYKQDMLYIPDYIINAGGLISVVTEFERKKPLFGTMFLRLLGIKKTLRHVFGESRRQHRPLHRVSNEMAESILKSRYAPKSA